MKKISATPLILLLLLSTSAFAATEKYTAAEAARGEITAEILVPLLPETPRGLGAPAGDRHYWFDTLGKYYAALVKETVGDQFDAMFGPAYKGIPLATACAGALAREYGIDKPYFFNRKEVKDHGEGGALVGYKPVDGDNVIIIEDVITAGTAVRETVPILKSAADVKLSDMFISVNRCEVGTTPGKTALMEVKEEFGITVHSIISVADIYEYLKEQQGYEAVLKLMEEYMDKYCIL